MAIDDREKNTARTKRGRGDGEQHVIEGRMVRRPERVEQGNSALFGGSTFYFIFYSLLKCNCFTVLC